MKLNLKMMRPQDLVPYELNAKLHDPAQVAKIARAITQHGWDVPIVVDRNNVIIKGHGRRLAALELGLDKVPVIVRDDLTPEQVNAARLADNRVAISDIDPEMLRLALAELETDTLDELDGIFDAKELEYMGADLGEMNEGAFITDMDATLDGQRRHLEEQTTAAATARVSLAKAFGFKDVSGDQQLLITRLMAKATGSTGKQGADALSAYLESHLETSE